MQEEIILDRFEYKLSENMYKVYKESARFIYKMKHTKQVFNSEDEVLSFIESTLQERKRYQQLLKTLSAPELSKLFPNIVLLGLTPAQIKEYVVVETFKYRLVIDEYESLLFDNMNEVRYHISDALGLGFYDYSLMTTDNQSV